MRPRRPLRAAAEDYLKFGSKWADLTPIDLNAELQSGPRIGPWTAGATVAETERIAEAMRHGGQEASA